LALSISDRAEEFRIEISGPFIACAVSDAASAWKSALRANTPRRVSVDITQMTAYDHAGYLLLREMHAHGTHIGAGTPKSLQFFDQISSPRSALPFNLTGEGSRNNKRAAGKSVLTMQPRAVASGE
jgi:hypothetical protein